MNEMAKILIGTLSGFVIAFFAEPIKLYFQNRSRIVGLRKALYLEMFSNYLILKAMVDDFETKNGEKKSSRNVKTEKKSSSDFQLANFIQGQIRTECYRQALNNESFLFYQLKEAYWINAIYSILISMLSLSPRKVGNVLVVVTARNYIAILYTGLRDNRVDKEIMKRIIGKEYSNFWLENPFS